MPLRTPPKSLEEVTADLKHMLETLDVGSDMACALVGAAHIEGALMFLLSKFLIICDESKNLFDIGRELESMSKCNRMAFCLGLTTRDTYSNVSLVAKVRNKFAHSPAPIAFTNAKVIEYCDQFRISRKIKGDPRLARSVFKAVIGMEWVNLAVDALYVKRLSPPKDAKKK
jgi:DNA-binding MltR family transcriptional regulator